MSRVRPSVQPSTPIRKLRLPLVSKEPVEAQPPPPPVQGRPGTVAPAPAQTSPAAAEGQPTLSEKETLLEKYKNVAKLPKCPKYSRTAAEMKGTYRNHRISARL